MGKNSKKHTIHGVEDQSNCMSGLIGMFDFRQGRSTQKLLSNKKYGNRRTFRGDLKNRRNLLTNSDAMSQSSDLSQDGDKRKIQKVDGAKTSVKKLMEEEMSNEQKPKEQIGDVAMKETQSDLKNGSYLGKNHKQATEVFSGTNSKDSASLKFQEPHDILNSEDTSSNKFSLVAVMEEICNQLQDAQQAHLHHENVGGSSDVQGSSSLVGDIHLDKINMQIQSPNIPVKLSEATESFLNQKFIEAEQQSRGHQSKLFMDALEMLNSNKDLFLKLLQDPNSLLMKHIEDLRHDQAETGRPKLSLKEKMGNSRECEKVVSEKKSQKQNVHAFFRRKIKSQKTKPSEGINNPQASNDIVLLKPRPEEKQKSGTEAISCLKAEETRVRNTSHFSFAVFGKKLKHVMGENKKEQRWPPILHRIPHEHPKSDADKEINEEVTKNGSPKERNFQIGRMTDASTKESWSKDLEPSLMKDHEPITVPEDAAANVDGQNITTRNVESFKQVESSIYVEAIKHLSDMVSTGKEDDLSSRQIPKTLGGLLSLPEYNVSPIFSSGKDSEPGSSTTEIRFQPQDNAQMINKNVWQLKEGNDSGNSISLGQSIETPLYNVRNTADSKLQVPDSNSNISKNPSLDSEVQGSICSAKEFNPEGGINSVETINVENPEEYIPLEMCDEPDCITALDTTNQCTNTAKLFEEEETSECSRLDSPEENQSSFSSSGPSSPSSVIIHKIVDPDGITDKPEQPSPVSVLEPFIHEDATSPDSTISKSVESPIQPLQISPLEYDSSAMVSESPDPEIYISCMKDKKASFEYVTAVLRMSGFSSWDEFMGRSEYTNQLLDPYMFDEVEVSSGQLFSDQKHLFDFINEVLVEVYERYFACSPWVSFGKPNIRPVPVGENLIREVWEGIDSHLLPQNHPLAMGQILEKDMEKGKCMDLRLDFELISNDLGDIILEELTEETIDELCT